MEARGVSREDRMKAGNLTRDVIQKSRKAIEESLKDSGFDHMGGIAVSVLVCDRL